MKNLNLLLLIITVLFCVSIKAQLVNSNENSQTPMAIEKPTKDRFTNDVDLFTGTLNSNYSLGSVSTINGTSFNVNLSYSSTQTNGNNTPFLSGIPYGEGWSVVIPTISCNNKAYYKYTIDKLKEIADDPLLDPSYTYSDILKEGDVRGGDFTINIPGVASGKLVVTGISFDGEWLTFSLNTGAKYIEAELSSTGIWKVFDDDGTLYQFSSGLVGHRNPSNQRYEESAQVYNIPQNGHDDLQNIYESDSPSVKAAKNAANAAIILEMETKNKASNSFLPNSQISTWYLTSIFDAKRNGFIKFEYEGVQAPSSFDVFRQPYLYADMTYYKKPLLREYRELVIKRIWSNVDEIKFNYEEVLLNNPEQNILRSTDPGVQEVNNFYLKKKVWSMAEEEKNFYRYRHVKAHGTNDNSLFANSTNPYLYQKFNFEVTFPYSYEGDMPYDGLDKEWSYFKDVLPSTTTLNVKSFDHGFLETPLIPLSKLLHGEEYSLASEITGSTSGSNTSTFDINIVAGSYNQENECLDQSGLVNYVDSYRNRHHTVHSTFNNGVKWFNYWSTNNVNLSTNSAFNLGSFPDEYGGIRIQIGPGNSENGFTMNPADYPEATFMCRTYLDESETILQTASIPNNFGVGLPWFNLLHFYYGVNESNPLALCSTSNNNGQGNNNAPIPVWWLNTLDQASYTWPSRPTRADESIKLTKLELYRESKKMNMLVSVERHIRNLEYDEDTGNTSTTLTGKTLLEYELRQGKRNIGIYDKNDTPITQNITFEGLDQKRNYILLSSIIEIGANDMLGDAGSYKTSFGYEKIDLSTDSYHEYDEFTETFFGLLGITSEIYLLNRVTKSNGYEEQYRFHKTGEGGKQYLARLNLIGFIKGTDYNGSATKDKLTVTKRLAEKYNYQYDFIVAEKTINSNVEDQRWEYEFSGTVRKSSSNFVGTKYGRNLAFGNSKYGFEEAIMHGPIVNGAKPKTITKFYKDYFRFGKVKSISMYDKNNIIVSKKENEYDVTLISESAALKPNDILASEGFDYFLYREEYAESRDIPIGTRPILMDIWDYQQTDTYNKAIVNYYSTEQEYDIWLSNEPIHPNISDTYCTDAFEPDYIVECDCKDLVDKNVLTESDEALCQTYVNLYQEWLDYDFHNFQYLDFTFKPLQSLLELPNVYNTQDFLGFVHQNHTSFKIHSYLVRLSKEKNTIYDRSLINVGQYNSITKVTEYEYYDADFKGEIKNDIFDEFLSYDIVDYIPSVDGLFFRPSYQLYSTKEYSEQYPENYSLTERFYFYDLLNNPKYHTDPLDPERRSINVNFKKLYRKLLLDLDNDRSEVYQVRTTKHRNGESTINNVFYEYNSDWDFEYESGNVTYYNQDLDCTPGSGIFVGGCYMWLNEDVPDHYCRSTGSLPPTYICPCETESAPLGGTQDNGGSGSTEPDNTEPDAYMGNEISLYSFLKNEYVQVTDENANKIASFDIEDDFTLDLTEFEVLNTRKILERDLNGFVMNERDAYGRTIKYQYAAKERHYNYYCHNGMKLSEEVVFGNHKGYPEVIEIWYKDELLDQVTFEYNLNNTIAKKTNFNQEVTTYEYDDFLRLTDTYLNNKKLEHVEYSMWTNDPASTYEDRIRNNYIEKHSFLDGIKSLNTRQYFNHDGNVVATTLNTDRVLNNEIYDTYGRAKVSMNPKIGDFLVDIDVSPSNIEAEVSNVYQDFPRSRPTKTAINGVNETDSEIIRYRYAIATKKEILDFLGDFESSHDLEDYIFGNRFSYTETTDEDLKSTTQIMNVNGELVATLTSNNQLALIAYNEFGEIAKVQDALGYVNTYEYNYLGQIYKSTSVDEGVSLIAYDERFLPIATKDGSGTTFLTRFDHQSKPIEIKQTSLESDHLFTSQGLKWIFEEDKDYYDSVYDHVDSKTSKAFSYGETKTNPFLTGISVDYLNAISNAKNRLVESISYDANGDFVESEFFNYDSFGRIKWKLNYFNFENISHTYRIDYHKYTLTGIPLLVNVDIGSDNILDGQYKYDYNDYFDLTGISFGFENSLVGGTSHRIVGFRYDDQFRLQYKDLYSTEYIDENGEKQVCNEVKETVEYAFTDKNRMKSISSTYFSQQLFYDDNQIGSFDANFNGNINSSRLSYDFIHDQLNDDLGVIMNTQQNFDYDKNNRLINFKNYFGENLYKGRANYTYDAAGNILTLNRFNLDENANEIETNYIYEYSEINNYLDNVKNGSNQIIKEMQFNKNGSINNMVNIDYDGTNSESSQSKIFYDRRRLIERVEADEFTTNYLYNASDKRIFSKIDNVDNNELNIQYYINDGLGHDICISDLNQGKLDWFVIGSERIAKIASKTVKGEQEVFIGSEDPPNSQNPWLGWDWQNPNTPTYQHDPDRGSHGWVYNSWDYTTPNLLTVSNSNDIKLQKAIRGHLSAAATTVKKLFPQKFHPVVSQSTNEVIRYDRKINNLLDTTLYVYSSPLQIGSLDQFISFKTNLDKRNIITVKDFVGIDTESIPPLPHIDTGEPFSPLIPHHDNPPLVVPYWFLYDHLGNTRMTLNYDCLEEEFFVTYAADYFPYGKPIWEYHLNEIDGEPLEEETDAPRYISTQHERDKGTGFDFRGARYYDSDVAMFLSVDPLAADFVAWSPYNYVLGNPMVFLDPDGRSPENIIIGKGNTKHKSYNNYMQRASFEQLQSLTSEKLSMDSNGNVTVVNGQGNMNASAESTSKITALINDNKSHLITSDGSNANISNGDLRTGSKTVPGSISKASDGTGTSSTIYFNPEVSATMCNTNCENVAVSAARVLGHEIAHAFNIMMGTMTPKGTLPEGNYPRDKEEQNATQSENKMFEEQRYDGTNGNY